MEQEELWRRSELDHVVYGWQPQSKRSARLIVRAEGAALWDDRGNRYVDFGSGQINVNIGYGNQHVLEVMQRQMAQATYIAPYFATHARIELASLVARRTPGDLNHIFFTNSGAEAIENALKIAKAFTSRSKFLSAWQSYHGATAGASAVSGDARRLLAEPVMPGTSHFHLPGQYRSPFHVTDLETEAALALTALEDLIAREGPHLIAGIVLEPIVGTNGLYVPPADFLHGIRSLCDRHGILFIADETMSGWGRTGQWFACDHYGLVPDILTTAKGITSGYVPLGAVAMRPAIYEHFKNRAFVGGLTTEGHALACAAGVANLTVYESLDLVERSASMGTLVLERLRELMEQHHCIGEVRGRGLFTCIELTSDRDTRRPLVGAFPQTRTLPADIFGLCLERGLMVLARENFIFVAPPLITSEEDISFGMSVLDEVLTEIDARLDSARRCAA